MEATLPTTVALPRIASYVNLKVPTIGGADWVDRAVQSVAAAVSTLVVVAGLQLAAKAPSPTEVKTVAAIGSTHAARAERPELVAIARVRELGMRAAGWDGGDAEAPNSQAVMEAEDFIYGLPLKRIAQPHISLATDGEINFFWKTEKGRLDLGFYGSGTYSYYARAADGTEYMEDDCPSGSHLPKKILELLAA